jgi:surface antigen
MALAGATGKIDSSTRQQNARIVTSRQQPGDARMIRNLMATAALGALVMSGSAQAIDPAVKPAAQTTPAVQTTTAADTGSSEPRRGGLLGGIFGCDASGNKQTIGTVAGGALGAVLGNRIAGSGSRTLGTVIGGALGAVGGSLLGCKLQKNDRDRAERAAEKAVQTGQSQDWKNEETGASGRVDVASAGGNVLGDLKFADGVEPASGYTKVADSFTTTGSANIRSAPGTGATVLGKLAAGQRVWVPAAVKGQPWMLISDGGVGQGYVSAPLLKRATNIAASNCKMVTQTVAVPGEAEQAETYHACKGKDGQWTMTRV